MAQMVPSDIEALDELGYKMVANTFKSFIVKINFIRLNGTCLLQSRASIRILV